MRRSGVRSSSAPPIELNGAGSPGIPILTLPPDVGANRRVVEGAYTSGRAYSSTNPRIERLSHAAVYSSAAPGE